LMLQAALVEEDKVTLPTTEAKDKFVVGLWERAAKVGYAKGQNNLGECHLLGTHGLKKDPALAVELFSESIENGDLKALWHLGCCYQHGLGVAKDINKAIEYWSQAAAKGDIHAKEALQQNKAAVVQVIKEKIARGVYHQAYDACMPNQKSIIDSKVNKEKPADLDILVMDPKKRGKFVGKHIKDLNEEVHLKVIPIQRQCAG
jgi:hypothetical protein